MDTTPTSTSRRRVVQGIAWAAPAVAMTAAAPAFAASCTPTAINPSGGPAINAGIANRPTSDQQLTIGNQVDITGLPIGVTVTKVTEQWFIENPSGQTSTGNGYWFLGNELTNWYKAGVCDPSGCKTVSWTGKAGPVKGLNGKTSDASTGPGKGWSSIVTNTQNNAPVKFSDGVTRNAWDVTLTWSPESGSGITPGAGGCNNFTTGPSGRFGINYYNAPTKATGSTVSVYMLATVYLSAGDPLIIKRTSTSVIKPV